MYVDVCAHQSLPLLDGDGDRLVQAEPDALELCRARQQGSVSALSSAWLEPG